MMATAPSPGADAPIVVTVPGPDDTVFYVQAFPSLPEGVRAIVKQHSGSFDGNRKAWWVAVDNRDRFLTQLGRDHWPYRIGSLDTPTTATRRALEECATCARPYKRGVKPERCIECGEPLRLVPAPA